MAFGTATTLFGRNPRPTLPVSSGTVDPMMAPQIPGAPGMSAAAGSSGMGTQFTLGATGVPNPTALLAVIPMEFGNGPEAYGLAAGGDTAAPNDETLIRVAECFSPMPVAAPREWDQALRMALATLAYNRMAEGAAGETRLVLATLMAIALNRLDSTLSPDGTQVSYADCRHRVVDAELSSD